MRKTQCHASMSFPELIHGGSQQDFPVVNDGHMVSHLLHFIQQMRGKKHGPSVVGDGSDNRSKNIATHDRVQPR